MRLESVSLETMLNELGQTHQDHPEWGMALAPAPLVHAALQGHNVRMVAVPGVVDRVDASGPRPRASLR